MDREFHLKQPTLRFLGVVGEFQRVFNGGEVVILKRTKRSTGCRTAWEGKRGKELRLRLHAIPFAGDRPSNRQAEREPWVGQGEEKVMAERRKTFDNRIVKRIRKIGRISRKNKCAGRERKRETQRCQSLTL